MNHLRRDVHKHADEAECPDTARELQTTFSSHHGLIDRSNLCSIVGSTARPHTSSIGIIQESSQQSSSLPASRPSLTKNPTMPSDVTVSTHQAPVMSSTARPTTTTKDSQPSLCLPLHRRSARLSSAS